METLRIGKTGFLQSTLTRAVIFSAMTNAIAFGSMTASSYPGLSSMGKLMALVLFCPLAAAVLFQLVLMGRPRQLEAVRPRPIHYRRRRNKATCDDCGVSPNRPTARAIVPETHCTTVLPRRCLLPNINFPASTS